MQYKCSGLVWISIAPQGGTVQVQALPEWAVPVQNPSYPSHPDFPRRLHCRSRHRSTEGRFDQLPDLLAELIRLKVDVIVIATAAIGLTIPPSVLARADEVSSSRAREEA